MSSHKCRFTAAEAIAILHEDSDIDETDDLEDMPEEVLQVRESDTSSDEDLYDADDAGSSSDHHSDCESSSSVQYTARNGETWTPLLCARTVRSNPANLVRVRPGVNPSVRYKASSSPYDCWKLFVDNSILIPIKTHTTREATKNDPNFHLPMEKLEAFISLQYARGIYSKSHSVDFLWSEKYGPPIFRETMSRSDFVKVKRYIRFDNKDCRSQRLLSDKFIHIRETMEALVSNCIRNYKPDWSLTVDEQLFPMKNRCPFIVFMPNKPDKFGMKFWVIAEVSSKYVCNILPYLGALEKDQRNGRPLAEDVVMRLTSNLDRNGGYNITTDNFFTSLNLAGLLSQRNMTIVGTVRSNSKGLPKEITRGEEEKFSSKFFYNSLRNSMLVNYQCKQKKNVNLLSTMHNSPSTDATEKKKPTVIQFYNQNKVGVDVFDQMARKYTTHAGSRRWPLAVWTNLLDIAALNSWILYRKCSGSNISRRSFILQLIEGLRDAYMVKRKQVVQREMKPAQRRPSGKRRKCAGQGCKNNTVTVCSHCSKPTCGVCGNGDWKLTECKNCTT
ncbi:unnamed protein product [Clavelina lepadiformis]|uniref:PiggyBac transposable element-derived protein domain-containing protein n=1 Tax=Clavelina lepadiformis TaxID=159417 RepID=A0ABP0GX23_CLALP